MCLRCVAVYKSAPGLLQFTTDQMAKLGVALDEKVTLYGPSHHSFFTSCLVISLIMWYIFFDCVECFNLSESPRLSSCYSHSHTIRKQINQILNSSEIADAIRPFFKRIYLEGVLLTGRMLTSISAAVQVKFILPKEKLWKIMFMSIFWKNYFKTLYMYIFIL